MGIIADFIANVNTIDAGNGDGHVGIDRALIQELEAFANKFDPPVTAADAVDQVQSLAAYAPTVSGGTFDLTFTLKNGETFDVDDIDFDADAATIESAIDSAATAASITGWTNGDISVAGDDLTAGPTTFTFDGDSVSGENHPLIVGDGGDLTGGGSLGAITKTTPGQTVRRAWGVLIGLGLVDASDMPTQYDAASAITANVTRESYPGMPSQDLIKALAHDAAVVDEAPSVETELKAAFSLTDR